MTGATFLERRSAVAEIRAAGRKLEGYAAVFDQEARIGGFTEVIRRGAFRETLGDGHDVLGLVDHDASRVLGRTRSGTLRLSEDSRGLQFEIGDLPNTTAANDALELVRSGNAGGASFAFRLRRDGEHWEGRKRELRAVDLLEVSVVSGWPAYEGTSVAARSMILSPARAALRAFLEARR